MAGSIPKVLVLGHSFVKRLKNELDKNLDHWDSRTVGLVGTAEVHLQRTGGRTVGKLQSYNLHVVRQLVVTLKSIYSVAVVCVCHVIPRGESTIHPLYFWERAKVLQQYLEFVLDSLDCVFCWCHKAFT